MNTAARSWAFTAHHEHSKLFALLEILSQITGYSHKITIMPPAGANRCSPNWSATQARRSAAAKRKIIFNSSLNTKKMFAENFYNQIGILFVSQTLLSIAIPVLTNDPPPPPFSLENCRIWEYMGFLCSVLWFLTMSCLSSGKDKEDRERMSRRKVWRGEKHGEAITWDWVTKIFACSPTAGDPFLASHQGAKKWQRMRYQRKSGSASGCPVESISHFSLGIPVHTALPHRCIFF